MRIVDSREARITARDAGIGRLNELTTWIAVGAVAAVGIFAITAAETIPGKASSTQGPSTSGAQTGTSTSTGTSFFDRHHGDSATISSSSGPGLVVTGGSR